MENTSYKVTIRNEAHGLLYSAIDNEKISRQIEKSIYNSTIKFSSEKNIKRDWDNNIFRSLYLSRIRSIYTNLNPDSYLQNKNFITKILEKKIDPANIASLSRYDIFPEVWTDLLKKLSEKDKLKYELKPEAMTDMFKCRKCSSRSCSYYEFQTRSADEPMTQFITCLDCNNNWKQ